MKMIFGSAVALIAFSQITARASDLYGAMLPHTGDRDCVSFHLALTGEDPEAGTAMIREIRQIASTAYLIGFAQANGVQSSEDFQTLITSSLQTCIDHGSNPRIFDNLSKVLTAE